MSGLSKAPAIPNEFCQKVRDSILSLGDNADAIANTLTSKGCQGTKGDGRNCPIAHYLHTEFGTFVDDEDILVSDNFIEVDECTFHKHQSAEELGMEVAEDHFLEDFVWEFVSGFDSGKYPDLVDPKRPMSLDADLDDEEYDTDWDDDDLDDEELDDDDDEDLDDYNDDEEDDDEEDDED